MKKNNQMRMRKRNQMRMRKRKTQRQKKREKNKRNRRRKRKTLRRERKRMRRQRRKATMKVGLRILKKLKRMLESQSEGWFELQWEQAIYEPAAKKDAAEGKKSRKHQHLRTTFCSSLQ